MIRARKPGRYAASAAVLALAAASASACGAPGASLGPQEAAVQGRSRSRWSTPRAGSSSSLGHGSSRAPSSPSTSANKAGGINGRQIELDVFDDQGDPTVGTEHRPQDRERGLHRDDRHRRERGHHRDGADPASDAKIPNITSGQSPGLVAVHEPVPVPQRPDQHRPTTRRWRSTSWRPRASRRSR